MAWTAFWNDLAGLELGREKVENGDAIIPDNNRKVHESISKLAQDAHDGGGIVEQVEQRSSDESGED